MSISKSEFLNYKNYLDTDVKENIKQYYLIPWIKNQKRLPALSYNLGNKEVVSINTYDEYVAYRNRKIDKITTKRYVLIDIGDIHPIEDHINNRVKLIKEKIEMDGKWIKPIIIDRDDYLLMDGHHRLEAAKLMRLKKLPAVKLNYEDVEIWSLKENEVVTKSLVRKRALAKNIYPNKTVKHYFNFCIENCDIPINELK